MIASMTRAAAAGRAAPGRAGARAYDVEGTAVDVAARRAATRPAAPGDVIGASRSGRTPTGPAFADAVTFAFGDAEAQALRARPASGSRPPPRARAGRAARSPCCSRAASRSRRSRAAGSTWPATPAGTRSRLAGLVDDGRASRCERWNVTLRAASGTGFELRVRGALPAGRDRRRGRRSRARGGMAGLRAAVRRHRRRARRRAADRGPLPRPARARAGASRTGSASTLARTIAAWPGDGPRRRALERAPGGAAPRRGADLGGAARRRGPVARRRPAAVDDLRRRRPPAPRRPRAVGRTARTTTRCAAPARCCAARRSTSARCASTARSSAGASRAGPASAATTSCAR